MTKWEYKVVDSKNVDGSGIFKSKKLEDVELYLNKLGNDGWEIINLDFRELEGSLGFSGVAKREVFY